MSCNTVPSIPYLDLKQHQRRSNVKWQGAFLTTACRLLCSSSSTSSSTSSSVLGTARVCTDSSRGAVFSLVDGGLIDSSDADDDLESTAKAKRIPWNKGRKFVPTKRTPEEQAVVEAQRRERISAANKGRLPWNTGKKHSPETIKLIREKTRLAMTDPEIKDKLRGYQQKLRPDVKLKIKLAVKKHWAQKNKVAAEQKALVGDWGESIAEAAKQGGPLEDELQWNSYKAILNELWAAVQQKKLELKMNTSKKKAPYTEEHRKRIADAIREKWKSNEYRVKVMEGMENLYKTRGRKPRVRVSRPKPVTTSAKETKTSCRPVRRKNTDGAVKINGVAHPKLEIDGKPPAPALAAFVDLESSEKMDKLKQLRASRMHLETKKKEAAERARMLMAEAEKAAMALEAVAFKDQFAMASLLETRRLLAEAAKSIEAVESGSSASLDTEHEKTTSGDEILHEEPSIFKYGGTSEEDEAVAATLPTESSDKAALLGFSSCWTEGDTSRGRGNGKSKARKRWHQGRLVDED